MTGLTCTLHALNCFLVLELWRVANILSPIKTMELCTAPLTTVVYRTASPFPPKKRIDWQTSNTSASSLILYIHKFHRTENHSAAFAQNITLLFFLIRLLTIIGVLDELKIHCIPSHPHMISTKNRIQ